MSKRLRDVHDEHGKPQIILVLRVGRSARARVYAVLHACHGVRTTGNVEWHHLGDRLVALSQAAKTYSSALQANIVLVRHHDSDQPRTDRC
jgi:hypothetical protein